MQVEARDVIDLVRELEAEIARIEELLRCAEERRREVKSQVA